MGATTFKTYVPFSYPNIRDGQVRDVTTAFNYAQSRARYFHGHGGYTGTIAEKDAYGVISDEGIPYLKATKMVTTLIEDNDPRIDDKWGPAGAIRIKQRQSKNHKRMDGWLFFGWASE
jgi:hypothetical protein